MTHARTTIALAGALASSLIATHAHAQHPISEFSLTMQADKTSVAIGETVTWSLTADWVWPNTDEWFQVYDLNIIASDDTLATASAFVDALTPLVNPTPGTPSGASIFGASGGQSPVLNPLGTIFSEPVTFGSFTVTAQAQGTLSYTVADGGVLSTDLFRVRDNSFGPLLWDGAPTTFTADTVTIVPAPAAVLILVGMYASPRRRRI